MYPVAPPQDHYETELAFRIFETGIRYLAEIEGRDAIIPLPVMALVVQAAKFLQKELQDDETKDKEEMASDRQGGASSD